MSTVDISSYEELFLSSATEHIEAIDQLLKTLSQASQKQAIIDEIFRRVHSLKGSSSIMKHMEISNLCTKIDGIIHPEGTFDFNNEKLQSLEELVSEIKNEIKRVYEQRNFQNPV